MAWGRTDDRECLDPRVGALSDREYRARHALLQLCSREYRDTGVFTAASIVHAAYGTPKGPRAVTQRELARLFELGFLHLCDADGTPTSDQQAADITPTSLLRFNNWERYNPPRDATNADRQRRFKERNQAGNDGDNTVTNSPSHARPQVRPPSRPKEQQPAAAVSPPQPVAAAADVSEPAPPSLADDLAGLGWEGWQVDRARSDEARARTALRRATEEASGNRGGYAWRLFAGEQPIDKPSMSAPARMDVARARSGARLVFDRSGGDLERVRDWVAGQQLSVAEREQVILEIESERSAA